MIGAILVFCLTHVSGIAPQTFRYTISTNGEKRGEQVDIYDGNHVVSTYSYNDRGRGPNIKAEYEFGPDGAPTLIKVTGVDYFKVATHEDFTLAGGKSSWQSDSGKGAGGGGYYLSLNGSGGVETAKLIDAARKSKRPVVMLPDGEVTVFKLGETTLKHGSESIHVTDYSLIGLGFTPGGEWVDDNGYFFASPSKWFGTIREGWESDMDALVAIDQAAEAARSKEMAKTLAIKPEHEVAFEHVRVFDSENARSLEDQTVVVSGEKIIACGPASDVTIPAGAQRIDGKGKTLLPGLYDMHRHIGELDGQLNIASGVVGVRDMGNDMATVKGIEDRWNSGEAIGPRLWKAGLIDGRGKFQAPIGALADTVPEAMEQIKKYADNGYMQIKLYSSLKPELVKPMAEEAHRRGIRVSGHVPSGMIAQEFVEAGADEIQHINFILLNFLRKQVPDTRSMQRFVGLGDNAAAIDLNSPEVKSFVKMLAARQTAVDVTLVAFEPMFTARPSEVTPNFVGLAKRLPVQVQRSLYGGGLDAKGDKAKLYRECYDKMLAMTKIMFDAGVPILVGTDAFAGLDLHRELELEVKAGIPALNALQNSTWVAAGVLKIRPESGSIAVGKRADLLLVEGDPTTQISDIRRTRFTMKGGILYDCGKVYQSISIQPAP